MQEPCESIEDLMADLLFLALSCGFFAVAVGFIVGLEKI